MATETPTNRVTPPGRQEAIRERLKTVRSDTWWTVVAATGVAIATALLAWSLRRSYFQSDDFVNVNVSRDMGFGWDYLRRSLFGHFLPGYRLGISVYDRAFGGSWWPSIVFQCGSLILCAWLIDRLGRLLSVSAAIRCAGALAFVFSLLHARSVVWFAAALNSWPVNVASLIVLIAVIRFLRSGRWPDAVVAAGALAAGMTFLEQTLTVGFALAAMAVLYREDIAPTVSVATFWRRAAAVGGGCVAVLLAYWGYYFSQAYADELPERSGIGPIVRFGWYAFFEGLFPALVGLRISAATPPGERAWIIVAGIAAMTVLVAAAALARRRSWRAWVVAASVLIPHVALVATGRVGKSGPTYGRELRYFSDVVWLIPLVVVLVACGPRRGLTLPRRALVGAAAAGALAFTAVAVQAERETRAEFRVSTAWTSDRYFDRFAATVPPADATEFTGVYDTQVPCCIQIPQLYPYSLVSKVVGLYDDRALFQLAPSHVVRDDGSVVAARFETVGDLDVPDGCVEVPASYVDIPLGPLEAELGQLFVRAEWEPGSATGTLGLVGGPASGPTGIAAPHQWIPFDETDEVAAIPLINELPEALWLRVTGSGQLCLNGVTVGTPVPRGAAS